jgi:hypothetical protein
MPPILQSARCEVQSGAREEPAEEAGPVLHPFEPRATTSPSRTGKRAVPAIGSTPARSSVPTSVNVGCQPTGCPSRSARSPPPRAHQLMGA